MKAMTVSDSFRSIINGRNVVHAFFTTYSFEPDFFELEILPVMLGNPSLSSNESIRYYQLQNLMRHDVNRFSVVYDNSVFEPQLAPRLQVDYLPMRLAKACQHAKIAVIVVKEHEGDKHSVVLCAGSFNLTKAGWWENIEVGHWVELNKDSAPANILSPLRNALAFFQANVSTPVLDAIIGLIADWTETVDDPQCSFYFSFNETKRHLNFDDFINKHNLGNGVIEIVSPFFALNADNKVIRDFLASYTSAKILLPVDDQGCALVDQKAVYEVLPNQHISWAQWNQKLRSSHLDYVNIYRRLHAKIYIGLSKNPWCFVGSVNFSFQAFRENIEAGFLLHDSSITSFLDPLSITPEKFKIETEDNNERKNASLVLPTIQMVFNWQYELLTITCAETGQLSLLNTLGDVILSTQVTVTDELTFNLPQIKEYLYRSSIFRARWQRENGLIIDGDILVSQRALFCRPNDLPSLDLQSLLRIFIGMHESRRLEVLNDLAIRLLHSNQDEGLHDEFLPELIDHTKNESFFAEFSQVNGAFWELTALLEKAVNNNDLQLLAYYLKGQQPDSLHKVVDSIGESVTEKSSASLITRYLTLLSVADILNRFKAFADDDFLVVVKNAISKIETEEIIDQLDESKGQRFLTWFKEKFYQSIAELTNKNMESL